MTETLLILAASLTAALVALALILANGVLLAWIWSKSHAAVLETIDALSQSSRASAEDLHQLHERSIEAVLASKGPEILAAAAAARIEEEPDAPGPTGDFERDLFNMETPAQEAPVGEPDPERFEQLLERARAKEREFRGSPTGRGVSAGSVEGGDDDARNL